MKRFLLAFLLLLALPASADDVQGLFYNSALGTFQANTRANGQLPLKREGGPSPASVMAVSASYTITNTDGVASLFVTTGASDRTITLPSFYGNKGRRIFIKKADSGAGHVIIAGTIDGTSTAALNTINVQNGYATVISNGSGWFYETEITEYTSTSGAVSSPSNLSGSPTFDLQWRRVGRIVNFHGQLTLDPTSAGNTTTSGQIALPFPSNIGSLRDLGGVGVTDSSVYDQIEFRGGAASDNMTFEFGANSVNAVNVSVTGSYTIQ